MASTIIQLPAYQWIKVNDESTKGVIQLSRGSKISLTQQAIDPNTMSGRIGRNGELTDKNFKQYYDTRREPNEFIWAMSNGEEGEIHVTPVGEVI